jgi:formyltetrahydrofolate-dependent phosphoribosylglycinamide formyltransferase
VLLSGSGRTLENFLACRARGELDLDIPIVVSSRPGVRGLDIARQAGIDTAVLSRSGPDSPSILSAKVYQTIEPYGVDLVLLAGWLRYLTVLPGWEGRILNIHPSLLPLFGGRGLYGDRVHEAVLASGMKVSGCTVHLVNHDYDAGPIIVQRCVPVLEDDTPSDLAARVFTEECRAYPEAIRLILAGRVRVEGKVARILPEGMTTAIG